MSEMHQEDSMAVRRGYALGGGEAVWDSPECLAYQHLNTITGQFKYYVRTGEDGKQFYSPTTQFDPNQTKHAKAIGRASKFIRVSESAFSAYLRYLSSGKEVHLTHAQREQLP